uniref:Uncharacterized protein n=1 Tax=Corvus moneduloides TaxID=1196302 RepID=A0A8U7NWH8_CORMO
GAWFSRSWACPRPPSALIGPFRPLVGVACPRGGRGPGDSAPPWRRPLPPGPDAASGGDGGGGGGPGPGPGRGSRGRSGAQEPLPHPRGLLPPAGPRHRCRRRRLRRLLRRARPGRARPAGPRGAAAGSALDGAAGAEPEPPRRRRRTQPRLLQPRPGAAFLRRGRSRGTRQPQGPGPAAAHRQARLQGHAAHVPRLQPVHGGRRDAGAARGLLGRPGAVPGPGQEGQRRPALQRGAPDRQIQGHLGQVATGHGAPVPGVARQRPPVPVRLGAAVRGHQPAVHAADAGRGLQGVLLQEQDAAEPPPQGMMRSYFGGLLCVCWSPDGRYVVTGGEDDLVTVWSFAEGRVVARGHGHKSWVNAVAFDPFTTTPPPPDHAGDDHGDAPEDAPAPPSVTYRFGSAGQDTQFCLWDLTEDVLDPRPPPPPRRVTTEPASMPGLPRSLSRSNSLPQPGGGPQMSPRVPPALSAGRFATLTLRDPPEKEHKRYHSLGNISRGGGGSEKPPGGGPGGSRGSLDMGKVLGTALCPRLHEVPLLEPLVCKKIAQERLTVLLFLEDCIVTGCQEGLICTWARPGVSGLSSQNGGSPSGTVV